MLPSYLLSLREGVEAALVIGVILGILNKMSRKDLYLPLWGGVITAILISAISAVGLNFLGAEFEGKGEQLFEGITMILAAGLLTWVIFWMHNQASTRMQKIESNVQQAATGRGRTAIFLLALLAVLREGIELGIFILAIRLTVQPIQQAIGALLGIMTAIALGWIFVSSTRKLNLAKFFRATNIILALFAAGLVGLAIHEFNELGWVPPMVNPIWNLDPWLPVNSVTGQLLRALFGYSSQPSLSQVLAYGGYLLFIVMMFLFQRDRKQTRLSGSNIS